MLFVLLLLSFGYHAFCFAPKCMEYDEGKNACIDRVWDHQHIPIFYAVDRHRIQCDVYLQEDLLPYAEVYDMVEEHCGQTAVRQHFLARGTVANFLGDLNECIEELYFVVYADCGK